MNNNLNKFQQLSFTNEDELIFISDTHLNEENFHLLTDYLKSLTNKSSKGIKFFFLGDIFDVFVGSDSLTFSAWFEFLVFFKNSHHQGYFIRGNRDFLIKNDDFQNVIEVLDDEVIVTIYHPEKVEHMLIAHGDQWCINDTAYMNFRQMVRQTQWQDIILAKPLYERQMMAQQIRMKSEIIKNNIGEYQDIEISALLNIVKSIEIEYGININTVIHGHTHAGKHYEITENVSFNRFVLSSWEDCMSHIQVHQDEVVLCKNII